MTNKELIEKYPFLLPRNVWTDKVLEDYDYSFCLLKDEIPQGWWDCFGIALCDDLKDILERNNCLDEFRFTQCKEKYSTIRLYDNGHPNEWDNHLKAWEYISSRTCIKCGKFPSKLRDNGWLSPWCDKCFEGDKDDLSDDFTLSEYINYNLYDNNGMKAIWIDMKPFYDKIGYKYKIEELEHKDE